MPKSFAAIATAIFAAIAISSPSANEFSPQIQKFFTESVQPNLSDPTIVAEVKRQNGVHVDISAEAIDSLDQQWRAEAKKGGGALIDKTLANAASKVLKRLKAAHPDTVTEVFVMDNRGLNVGQSDVTSDYMQGDESKWQKTYAAGAGSIFIDEVEFDESTQKFQSQISATISDPATGKPIGAITVGLNIESLL